MSTPTSLRSKVLMSNRQATYAYVLGDQFEAGLVLEGWEVKAILAGQATFNGGNAHVRLRKGEAYLEQLTITPRRCEANQGLLHTCDPLRPRKLLLKKAELKKLTKRVAENGYTLVPIALVQSRKLKLQVALAKGKNQADKRHALKERDQRREQSLSALAD